jgi:nucleotide-binding universal stress UspA family protein
MNMNNNIFSKILVPVDGSINSMKAIDYAVDIAEKYKSELLAPRAFSLNPQLA